MATVKQNTLYVAIGQVLRQILALILLPISSRLLGDQAFGRYALATTMMFFVMLVDDMGVNMWLTREIAKNRDQVQSYLAHSLGLKIVLVVASTLFILLILAFTNYDSETIQSIWIFALYGVLISFRDLGIAIFRAFENMVWATVVETVEKALITVLGIIVLLSGGHLIGLAWVFVASAAISVTLCALLLSSKLVKPTLAFSYRKFITMLKAASAFGISVFLTSMYSRIDMLMLSVMKGPEVWGWYSAAHKLIDFTNFVPMVFMIATFPTFSRFSVGANDRLNHLFTRGFKYLFLLAIPMIPGVYLLSDAIIQTFYGSDFINAVPALKILGITAAILFINIYAAGLYGATNHQSRLVIIQVFGMAINATFNYFLIPKMAHVGASLATLITESLVLTITLYYAFKKITRLTETRFLGQVMLATLAMALFLYFFKHANVFFIVAISVGIYFAILLLLKTIRIQELVQFRGKNNLVPLQS